MVDTKLFCLAFLTLPLLLNGFKLRTTKSCFQKHSCQDCKDLKVYAACRRYCRTFCAEWYIPAEEIKNIDTNIVEVDSAPPPPPRTPPPTTPEPVHTEAPTETIPYQDTTAKRPELETVAGELPGAALEVPVAQPQPSGEHKLILSSNLTAAQALARAALAAAHAPTPNHAAAQKLALAAVLAARQQQAQATPTAAPVAATTQAPKTKAPKVVKKVPQVKISEPKISREVSREILVPAKPKATGTPNQRFLRCCQNNKNIPQGCYSLCNFDNFNAKQALAAYLFAGCGPEVRYHLLSCGSSGHDHRTCCRQRKAPEECMTYCYPSANPVLPGGSSLSCLNMANRLKYCYETYMRSH